MKSTADFLQTDGYIEYDHEEVMWRWDSRNGMAYKKFYGEPESTAPVPKDDKFFFECLMHGREIDEKAYRMSRTSTSSCAQ